MNKIRDKISIILENYCQTEFLIANAKEAYSQEGVDTRLNNALDDIMRLITDIKDRQGNSLANLFNPVPSSIAAVMAIILESLEASSVIFSLKASVNVGTPFGSAFSPVSKLKGPVP